MILALSIVISTLALILAALKIRSLRSLRGFMVLFALGAGQIHLALLAVVIFLFAEDNYSPPLYAPQRSLIILSGLFFGIIAVTLLSDTRGRTVIELAQLALYIFIFLQLQSVLRRPGQLEHLLRLSAFAAIAVALLALMLQFVGLTEVPAIFMARGPNEAATYLLLMGAVPCVFMFLRTRKLIYILGILLIIFVQLEATSRTNVVLSSACLLAIGFFIWKPLWIRIVLSLATAGIIYTNFESIEFIWDQQRNFSLQERIILYESGTGLWQDSPWVGWGWGSTSELTPQIVRTGISYPHFHSTYIQFLVELGALGILIIIAWISSALVMIFYGIYGRIERAYAAYLVISNILLIASGFAESMLFGGDRAVLTVIVFAINIQIITKSRPKRRRRKRTNFQNFQNSTSLNR